jgi:phage-related holin
MLTLKKSKSPIGLLVKKVLDQIEGIFHLDCCQLHSDFVFGTVVYNKEILIFLNPAAIIEGVENDKVSNKIARKAGIK